jgi:metallopeptidase MepB
MPDIGVTITVMLPPQPLPRILTAGEIIPTIARIIADYRSVRDAVAQAVTLSTACFESVIRPLIDTENRNQGDLAIISMLRFASPDKDTRDGVEEAQRLFREAEAEITAREDLYLLIKAVKNRA